MFRFSIAVCISIMLTLAFNAVVGLAASRSENNIEEVIEPDSRIEEVLEVEEQIIEPTTKLEYYRDLISSVAELYDVDPVLAVSVSRLETGNFESRVFIEDWNFGGITGRNGKLIHYETELEGVIGFIECLEWYKNDLKLVSVDEMAGTYCPPNKVQWAKSVKQIMKEEETYGLLWQRKEEEININY